MRSWFIYGIAQQSGAQICVNSEVGRGTAFKIYFPRLDSNVARHSSPAPAAASDLVGGTVLIVEDDAAVRQVAARILRARGFIVLEARRPSEGRIVCAEQGSTIDLRLTDVVMPECTGPQLARELTAQHPRMRVLYMSGYPGGAAQRSGSLEPGTPYVEQPFSPSILVERVCAALAGPRGL